jgi:diguanylate cyclase (GGDEF)-like protein
LLVVAVVLEAAVVAVLPYDQVVTVVTTFAELYLLWQVVLLLRCGIAHAHDDIRDLRGQLDRALTDPVTGLPVRRVAEDAITSTNKTVPLTVALADVDRLHDINRGPGGHAAGDLYLAEVARRLRQAAHDGDTVARLGGDEFVLISPRDPAQVADSLTAAFAPADAVAGIDRPIEVSVGICHLPGGDPHHLLSCASLAMITAKNRRTGIELYDPTRDGLPLPVGVRPAVRRRDQRGTAACLFHGAR